MVSSEAAGGPTMRVEGEGVSCPLGFEFWGTFNFPEPEAGGSGVVTWMAPRASGFGFRCGSCGVVGSTLKDVGVSM